MQCAQHVDLKKIFTDFVSLVQIGFFFLQLFLVKEEENKNLTKPFKTESNTAHDKSPFLKTCYFINLPLHEKPLECILAVRE